MTAGSETAAAAEPATLPPETPPQRKRSRGRWLRRLLAAGMLLAVLAVVLLFAPGWPLGMLAPIANHVLEPKGMRVGMGDLWLRAHLSGQLELTADRLSAGDRVEAEAVVIETLAVTWPFARLLRADPLSVEVAVGLLQVAPRLDESGQWKVLEPVAGEAGEASIVAEETETPVTPPLLQRFWRDPEHPLRINCAELRIVLPENSPFAARRLTLAPTLQLSATEAGTLALAGSLGEVHLDDPLLATATVSGTIDLDEATAELQLKARLEDSAPLGLLLPPEQSMPAQLAIDAGMDLVLAWDPLAIESCVLRLLSAGGDLRLPDRSQPLPAWEVRVAASAQDFNPLPQAEVTVETDLWAEGADQAPAQSRLEVALDRATSLVDVRATTGGWTLGMLRPWVEGLAELDATGSVGAELAARYDLETSSLLEAHAILQVEAGHAFLPGVLKQAIEIAPTRFVAEIGPDFESGEVLPFSLIAGPVQFRSEGLRWSFREGQIGGRGSFTLILPSGSDLPLWLAEETLAKLPATPDECKEIAFAPIQIDIAVTGTNPDAIEIACDTHTRLLLNDGQLELETATQIDTAQGTWNTTLALPTFDPGSWHMRLFKRLPVPDLALPMSLQLRANGTLAGELHEAGWEYRAGPGIISPNGPLAQWLQAEVPVDQFILGGRLRGQGRIAELDTCDFRSGRARLRFTRAQVDVPQSVLAGMPTEATVHFGLLLENWHPIDFLPLLAGELREQIPLSADEMEGIGLVRLELTAETHLGLDDKGVWRPRALQAAIETDFVGGDADIPVSTQIDFDPDSGMVTATATSARISPEIWKLKPLALLPVELTGTAVPFEFAVRLSAGLPGLADNEVPRVGFVLKAGPGPLHAPAYLQAPVGLDALELDLQVRLDSLELEEASVLIDLDGPVIRLDRLQAVPNEALTAWQTAAHLSVEDLTLEWALAKVAPALWQESVPSAFLPETVKGAVQLDLGVATLVDTGNLGRPAFDQLAYELTIADLQVDWADRPSVSLATLNVQGGADACTLRLHQLGTGKWAVARLVARINDPLAEIPFAQVEANMGGELSGLSNLFEAWSDPLELGGNPVPAGLEGTVEITLNASAPVDPAVDLKAIQATVRAEIAGLPLAPLVPDGPTAGFAGFVGAVSMEGGIASADGKASLTGLMWAPFLEGDATVSLHAESDPLTASGGIEADLTLLQLTAPDDLWRKPRGQAAHIAAGGSLPEGWPEAGPRKALWNMQANGFVFAQLATRGTITLDPRAGAPYGGLQRAELDLLEFDAGKLHGAVTVAPERIDLALTIDHFDLPLLMQRTAAIARPLQEPGEEPVASLAATPPPPAAEETETPALPPIHCRLLGHHLQLGGTHTIQNLAFEAHLINALPETATLRFELDGDPLQVSLGAPNADRQQAWSLEITDAGRLFDGLTAPTRAAPSFFPPASPVLALNAHVGSIVGGHLMTSGWVNLRGEAPVLDATLKLEGIAFHQEIPLLSKFAALAKKDFKLKVPCHVFEWAHLHFENNHFTARDGFIDGPINLSFESVLADLEKETLNAKGKVFALCYELDGPLTAPSPYLCEDSAVIRALTQEDEFVW